MLCDISSYDGKYFCDSCSIAFREPIVLMAVIDSQYLFRLVDVGAPGRFSDGGIFQDSLIGKQMHEGKLNLP